MSTCRFAVLLVLIAGIGLARADDWVTFRHDASRSGVTADQLPAQLHRQWTWAAGHAPMPAWPEPGKEMHRIPFDYAPQVAVAGGMVYFGSSADHQVRALDAATGTPRWRFFTDGPVRFSPYVADGRVFVGSDDGLLYCLDGGSGEVIWQQRGGPADERVIGNGQMCSRWPLRTGVAVEDGTCYYAAGMWPAEGVYIYAVRAADGEVALLNDSSGQMYMKFPHPTAEGISGVAPQGHIVVYKDRVMVPTGRSLPAGFDRDTLELLYYRPDEFLRDGGSWTVAAHDMIFAPRHGGGPDTDVRRGEAMPSSADGITSWDMARGNRKLTIAGKHRLVFGDAACYASGGGTVGAYDLQGILARKKPADCAIWEVPHERAYSLIKAGDAIVVGGEGTLTVLAADDGEVLFKSEMSGQVRGLAVSDGRLYASMTTGEIACFGGDEVADAPSIRQMAVPMAADDGGATALAERILAETGATAGYCLDLSADGGQLALALASRSELVIHCIEPDAQRVAAAREMLDRAGVYGSRVSVHQGTLDALAHPNFFADLIVAGPGFVPRASGASEMYRTLSPCDGRAYFAVGASSAQALADWLRAGRVLPEEISVEEDAVRIARGPLPGAGSWSHAYADAGQSGCADDDLVKWPMRLLWFGGPGPELMISRHWRAGSPVSAGGRLFIAGQHNILAMDAYTGRELWLRDVRSVGRRAAPFGGGNVAADDDSVYAATGSVCFRIDAATGEDQQLYRVPAEAPRFVLDEPREFELLVDDAHSARITVAATDEGLSVTLVSVDDMVTNLHRDDGPVEGESWAQFIERLTHNNYVVTTPALGDSWELFLDLRPSSERGGLYGRGAFQTIIVPATGEEDLITSKPAAGEVHPQMQLGGGLTPDGTEVTVLLPWSEMEALVGDRPTSIALGATLNSSDDGDKLAVASHRFANADSYRLTNGWATFALDPAAAATETGGADVLPAQANETHVWGYLAMTESTIIGTAGIVPQAEQVKYWSTVGTPPGSDWMFALDKDTGRSRWVFEASHSIIHNTIVIGDGRVFLIDRTSKADLDQMKRRGEEPVIEERLVALDIGTGEVIWETTDEIAGRDNLRFADGTVLASSRSALSAFDADGTVKWTSAARSRGFPVVAGGVVYAEPGAFDLQTGEPITRTHPLTGDEIDWTFRRAYGCGSISASTNMLFFRSGAMGMYDLAGDSGLHNFGGIRPGCYINVIAANGLTLMPNGDSACTCAYSFQTSLALEPVPVREENWSVFSVETSASARLRQVRLNIGAPGDGRDADDSMWLCVPRPIFPRAVQVPMAIATADDGGYFRDNADDTQIASTDMAWLYASGCEGVERASLDLMYDRPITCLPSNEAPVIDGDLDDACWYDAAPLTLTDKNALANPRARALMRRTEDAVVFGLHTGTAVRDGETVAWDADTTGEDATVWTDDSWLALLTDRSRKNYLALGVSPDARYDALCNYERRGNVDVKWSGQWESATAEDADGWTAEVSVPLETLREVGLDPDTLRLNLFAYNKTGVGPEEVRLVYPGTYGWRKCYNFKSIVFAQPEPDEMRTYSVTLHFADLRNLTVGQRVFDIVLQGETVAEDFDIARETGGELAAVARTFEGIRATDRIELELLQGANSVAGPVISGIEIEEE